MGKLGQPIGVPLAREIDHSSLLSMCWYPGSSSDGVDSATSTRTNVSLTANATPHAVGAYTEVVASLSENVSGIYFQLSAATNTSTVDSSTLLDIAIGGAGSETNIVENIPVGYKILLNVLNFIPVSIPKGTRVAMRIRSAQISKNITVRYIFMRAKRFYDAMPSRLISMGANTGVSGGTTLTAPGSLNTKSAWTEITASTTEPFQGVLIGVQGAQSGAVPGGNTLIDIGINSAGNEVAIVSDIFAITNASEAVDLLRPPTFTRHIPAGTRLSVRYARSATAPLDVVLHGIPY